MEFGKESWKTFEQGIQKEWLLTNGLGGFACSTIVGANTRRYHGLLVASLRPPVERHLILSKLDESILTGSGSHDLYTNQTPDHITRGYLHLQRFILDPLPNYVYNLGEMYVEKKIAMVYRENTTIVRYYIVNKGEGARIRIAPLVNFRDYHYQSLRSHMRFTRSSTRQGVRIRPYDTGWGIHILCSEDDAFVSQEDSWFMGMDYAVERERGLDSIEDHFIPGYFEVPIMAGEEKYVTVTASLDRCRITPDEAERLIEEEEERIRGLGKVPGCRDELICLLVRSADHFVVSRQSTGTRTIIAGYPWFTDWGRDTMIAFTGLTLVTGRFQDAREILETFARYTKDGLVPNMFPDTGQEPLYNTVDAALWYFEAVNNFLRYTGEYELIFKNIYDVLKEIIAFYMKGTVFHIRMDHDGLITAGDEQTQLTWMDAKVGDWVVTPRHGKAVEINALWYNALRVMGILTEKFGEDNGRYNALADQVKASFVQVFWNEENHCLYDVVSKEGADDKIRPNQIFAAGLSFPVLEGEKAKMVVNTVWRELYTAYGLRSLARRYKEYTGVYSGDQYRRDSAYHQGTVWSWLIGYFVTAYRKAYGSGDEARKVMMRFIKPFEDHLKDACLGSISEIFDGDEPLLPRGCFAQAWSVAEVLRAYAEDIIGFGMPS